MLYSANKTVVDATGYIDGAALYAKGQTKCGQLILGFGEGTPGGGGSQNLNGVSPITYSSITGDIGINQASGSQSGYLSNSDWTTFNNKQTLLTAGSNININGNIISAVDTKYTAGVGIYIDGTVIHATGGTGGEPPVFTVTDTLSVVGWNTTIVWTPESPTKISRSAGQINLPSGTVYNISAGMLDGISDKAYIYFDKNVSETVLQNTTSAANAIGIGKLMVCVVFTGQGGSNVLYQAFGTIGSADLVTHEYISPGAVETVNIALGAIQEQLISAGAITTTKIGDNAITTPKLAAGSITGVKIASDTITAANIIAGAITASEIATGAVTADKISTGAITAQKIASRVITANHIASKTITAYEVAANSITANEINTNTINSLNLTSGTITGVTITGGLFRTGSSGKRIEISSSGTYDGEVVIYNEEGSMTGMLAGGYNSYMGENGLSISGLDNLILAGGASGSVKGFVISSSSIKSYGSIIPASTSYSIGTSSTRWNIGYFSTVYLTSLNTGNSVVTANTSSTYYVNIQINGEQFKLLLAK